MNELIDQNKTRERDLPVLAGLCIVIFLFLASAFLTYSNIFMIKKNYVRVAHAYEMMVSLDTLLSLMKDAETGQRGYILTGKESYLEPYTASLWHIEDQLRRLNSLTQNSPEQRERLSPVRDMVSVKLNEFAETVELRRRKGLQSALNIILTDRGENVMRDLRTALAEMREVEGDIRKQRIREMKNSHSLALATGLTASLLGIVLSIIVFGLLRHTADMRRRREWLQAGKAGLSTAMLGDLTVEQLGENVLKFLAEYFGAHAGIFFTRENGHFSRTAAYGISANGGALKSFEINDGLLGQTVRDVRIFVVRDAPDGYMRVGSGLGQANPRHFIIAPAVAEKTVNAVLEFGFIQALDDRAVELLNEVSEIIGIAVQSADYRKNLQKLLNETQAQAEELQAQSEELRVSNEELERFAYICSHDMQEPVRMMHSYSELLGHDYAENFDADGAKYLKFITENARQMRKMISDILTFSRIGRETPELEMVRCEDILRDVLQQFDDIIRQTKAKITHDPLPEMVTSATMMQVLFQNLIGNALKFQDGSRPPVIHIGARKRGNHWEFMVRDNGIGIDPSFHEKVFDIFERYHRKENYSGTGIGLSACKKFVEIYGGKIWFKSMPGEGSIFYFSIPEQDQIEQSEAA